MVAIVDHRVTGRWAAAVQSRCDGLPGPSRWASPQPIVWAMVGDGQSIIAIRDPIRDGSPPCECFYNG